MRLVMREPAAVTAVLVTVRAVVQVKLQVGQMGGMAVGCRQGLLAAQTIRYLKGHSG